MSSVAAEKMADTPQPMKVMKVRMRLFRRSMCGDTPEMS